MPIRQPFYLNDNNLYSATAVFLDAAQTVCAPNGFYSDGNIVRELVDCVLLPLQQCPNCCSQPCTSWHVVGNSGPFTLKYGACGTQGVVVEDYPDGTNTDICVVYGDVPNIVVGNADLSINRNCGCCAGPCETWSITNVTEAVQVSCRFCGETSDKTVSVAVGATLNICIESGTFPTIVLGAAIVQFDSCDCID